MDSRRSNSQVSTNVVSPDLGSIKSEPKWYAEESVFHGENMADIHGLHEVKRRRLLDPSLEELDEYPSLEELNELQSTVFWSGGQEQPQFDEQAFMKNPLFHLNSFVQSKVKPRVNEAFSEFIREGVYTPGFWRFPRTRDIEKIANWSYSELKDFLVLNSDNDEWGASQVALWLKNATVGSFVIMRHEYEECPFCPKRLFDADGKYIGPVYVIGVITKKVVPWSEEEWDIENNKMGEFTRNRHPIHTVCKIDWKLMGFKDDLEDSTKRYMNRICQPTLQQICKPEKVFNSERIRYDLWAHAEIEISSDEFPDRFEHEGIW